MEEIANSLETADWLDHCFEGNKKQVPDSDSDDDSNHSVILEGIKKSDYHRLKNASKPHSTPNTLKWLEENYEFAEGVCIPRSTLYLHYLDFCQKNDSQPVNAASFGKIIRQQFPQITTRRLGTRGQSKYHYYGIGVRESSRYYEIIYSAKGVQSSSDGKKEALKQVVAYSPRSKLGTLLPEFPNVKDIKLPLNVPEDKVVTFLMMYRTHCQRILDTVIRANFDEVQNFLLHFWQGMPQHIVPILDSQTVATLVGICDTILYKAISSVLMPTVLQALPESLTQVIRKFAKQLDEWLLIALDTLPETLRKIKFDLARRFSQVLRRQTSLNHLCQAARGVIHSSDITSQMLDDWMNVDFNSIIKQTLYTMDSYSEKEHQTIVDLCEEFRTHLEEQSPTESYIQWLDSMVDKCVVQPSVNRPGTLRRRSRQFLLMWSCFGTRVIRDMTLHSAPSFGSFHLLHLMFDDYVLHLVETLHGDEKGNEFLRFINGEEEPKSVDDVVLPDTAVFKDTRTSAGSLDSMQPYTLSLTPERCSVITNGRHASNPLPGHRDSGIGADIHESSPPGTRISGTFCSPEGHSPDIAIEMHSPTMNAGSRLMTSESFPHGVPYNVAYQSHDVNNQHGGQQAVMYSYGTSTPFTSQCVTSSTSLNAPIGQSQRDNPDWQDGRYQNVTSDGQTAVRMQNEQYQQFSNTRGYDYTGYAYDDPSSHVISPPQSDGSFQSCNANYGQPVNYYEKERGGEMYSGKRKTAHDGNQRSYKRTHRENYEYQIANGYA